MQTARLIKGVAAVHALMATGIGAQGRATPWPSGRVGHVMAYDALRNESVMIGGDTDSPGQTRDSLWAWSGSGWRVSAAEGPSWRTLPALAFDSKRGRIVLFGGLRKFSPAQYADSAHGDTWEWDGTRWSQARVNSPGAIDHHAMTFDEARGVVVMQGGGGSGQINDGATWTYDGSSWTRVADGAAGPGQRVHHAMAYDSRRQRVVLYGGFGEGNTRSPDVWEWDGSRWHRIVAPGPGTRSHHRLAYDAARGVTLLYGGVDDRVTWTWNGTEWKRAATEGPPNGSMVALAYDTRRQRVVLFGGGFPMQRQLWEWDGTRWTNATPVPGPARP
jgi:hypothetical protein